jgi:hypothetical protein
MCIVLLDRNKTVFHEVHIELRVARSTVQLVFVLGVEIVETEHFLLWNEVRSAFAPWVISEGLCLMGYRTPVPLSKSRV